MRGDQERERCKPIWEAKHGSRIRQQQGNWRENAQRAEEGDVSTLRSPIRGQSIGDSPLRKG